MSLFLVKNYPLPFSLQVTLGVLLVVPPVEVWGVWSGLGGLWVITFIAHEIAFHVSKVTKAIKGYEEKKSYKKPFSK